MTTFLDTDIVLSLLNEAEPLHAWSTEQLAARKAIGPVVICDIVYCETSIAMASVADVNAAIEALGLERLPESDGALFRAGKAFRMYRDVHRGPKTGVKPDFLIGAVAETSGAPLVTNNQRDYIAYFPEMQVISP